MVNVAAMVIFMKLSREHVQIRQVVTVGTLTSLYEQVQNFNVVLMVVFILLCMLLFLHNLHFIFEKPAIKIKIDAYKLLKGMHTPLQVCIHSI